MSEYVKKVLIFDETQAGFSVNGKRVSGVLKIEKVKNKCTAEVFITNFNRRRADGIECVLRVDKDVYHALSDSGKFALQIDRVGQYDDIACLVAAVSGDSCVPFAFASNNDRITSGQLKQGLKGRAEQDETEYEQFVCATDNYFQKEDASFDLDEIRKKSVSKFKPIEELGNAKAQKGKNFFAGVKNILKKIFETYPPCDELNEQMKNSFWVKVPFRQEKYFVVGLVEKEGRPEYIVYGVPGRRNRKPNDDSFRFVATKNGNEGFWMLYQDVKTGLCAEKVAVNG